MDGAARKFIRHPDLGAWPSGGIGGVGGDGGDEEGGGGGGESDAEERDNEHGGDARDWGGDPIIDAY